MLTSIEAKNFLSYSHVKLSINKKQHTTLVLGDVGSGKSSLFEMICWGLYGCGRTNVLSEVKRIGIEGDTFVELNFEKIKGYEKPLKIVRGLKTDNSGYLQVWYDGQVLDKGGAKVASNNSAQETINNIFSATREEYLLSSFFGLGTNDLLFKAYPSEKLDILQKFVGIDVCNEINSTALKYSKDKHKTAELIETQITTLLNSISDIKDRKQELKKAITNAQSVHTELNRLYVVRVDLLKQESRYQSIVRQSTGDKLKRESLINKHENDMSALNTAKIGISVSKKSLVDCIKRKDKLESKISEFKYTPEVMSNKITENSSNMAEIRGQINLYKVADITDSMMKCPLCSADLDKNHKISIKKTLIKLQKRLDELQSETLELGKLNTSLIEYSAKLIKVKSKIKTLNDEIKEGNEDIKNLMKSISSQTIAIRKIDNRIVETKEELRNHNKLLAKISDLDESISKWQIKSGGLDSHVKDLRDQYRKMKSTMEKVDNELKPKVDKLRKEAIAYKFIAEAFSKYNIPNQLLKSVKHIIEIKATQIFNKFDNGEIRIDDIPGEKPGIDFYLVTSEGKKPYHLLSTGEQTLVYLSVRIAMSIVLSNIKNNNIKFLVLDEIAGNLDPDKRDILAGVVDGMLRQMYEQVFVTSHVELPDVFDSTINVKKKGAVSRIEGGLE
jgi:DNA repair exonuclease SbcCD ATPase subunit